MKLPKTIQKYAYCIGSFDKEFSEGNFDDSEHTYQYEYWIGLKNGYAIPKGESASPDLIHEPTLTRCAEILKYVKPE